MTAQKLIVRLKSKIVALSEDKDFQQKIQADKVLDAFADMEKRYKEQLTGLKKKHLELKKQILSLNREEEELVKKPTLRRMNELIAAHLIEKGLITSEEKDQLINELNNE